MSIERCLDHYSPFSDDFKLAAEKFTELNLHKKVAVVAESAIAGVKSFFIMGAGAFPVFRSLVNKWTSKEFQKADQDGLAKDANPVDVKSKHEETKEELASRIGSLAKRWVFKVIPKVVPEMKVPFKIIKIAKKSLGIGRAVYNKDLLGTMKKIIPIVFTIIGTIVGGPVFGAIFLALKIYGWASLFFDTATEAKNVYSFWIDRASEPTKTENLFESTILAAATV
ncbi:hypothetical protein [Estrella lausannensis]|uniref:Putative membrane protein n=1 Tax=Estrella lausannensis TaxID=483423 RepID=A0A0H5DPL6_9BACT|nr:hypothetical protein [Estrella lausannensis]CRX37424.1 Putative membrane protein [Estrella lausannensis]